MTKQKFGTKLSGRDRLTETCCAEKHWLLKTENQRKYACLRPRPSSKSRVAKLCLNTWGVTSLNPRDWRA